MNYTYYVTIVGETLNDFPGCDPYHFKTTNLILKEVGDKINGKYNGEFAVDSYTIIKIESNVKGVYKLLVV